jgi:hypothetical protein
VRAILKNPQNGIKAEELKWTGIEQAVERIAKENGGKVPKEALLKYLAEDGAVRLEEVTLGAEGAELRKKLRVAANEMNEQMRLSGIPQKAMALGMSQLDAANLPARIIEGKVSVDSLPAALQPDAQKYLETNQRYTELMRQTKDVPEPRYGSYQLPGGENYREVVLAMPSESRTDARAVAKEFGYGPDDILPPEVRAEIDRRVDSASAIRDAEYRSTHYPNTPNYVAHARLNERTDAAGKPGLFLEEIQSDRHQAGREKGYAEKQIPTTANLVTKTSSYTLWDVFDQNGKRMASDKDAPTQEAAIASVSNQISGGIPDAPFRKDWPVQMFKRALADAVENGKEWIGWTTGEMQAARYDLSKQVKMISAMKMTSGKYLIYIEGTDGGNLFRNQHGFTENGQRQFTPQELRDFVGKEAADNVIRGADQMPPDVNGNRDWYDSKTSDLKVGGEGMKGFYDQILPKEISKYVKQWGGQVEKAAIDTSNPVERLRFDVVGPDNRAITAFETMTEARAAAKRAGRGFRVRENPLKDPAPIWRVNITPQMRESIKKAGQALFVGGVAAVVAEQEQQ